LETFIQHGIIQGNTLGPNLFIIFLEPLLRWLKRDEHGYTFKTSKYTISSATWTDDLVLLTSDIKKYNHKLKKKQIL
jgi:hypothetical protein